MLARDKVNCDDEYEGDSDNKEKPLKELEKGFVEHVFHPATK